MSFSRVTSLGRSAVLVIGLLVAAAAVWSATAEDRAEALAPQPTLDALVTAGAGVVLSLALIWATVLALAVGATPVVGDRMGGALVTRLGCPAGLHRLLALACGVAVAGTIAGATAASATDAVARGPADPRDGDTSVVARLDGLPLPDRPTGAARADATSEVGVVPGDCLWRIARARLGAQATNAEIDRAWRAIYRANRDRIGDDPDLILPGVRLDVPASLTHHPAGTPGALEEER